MALRGFLLSRPLERSAPLRTCTGCRAIVAQGELVRVAFDGPRLALDPRRRQPGRGAYVHPKPGCVTAPGLARSLRRTVTPADVQRLVSEMSPSGDTCGLASDANARTNKQLGSDPTGQNGSGLNVRETVEIPSTAEQRTTGV